MKKRFLNYVLPSMLAFAFSGLYSVVDGLFIGRNIGDFGLAAINFAYPIVVLIQAVGTGIGLGGSVGISIAKGKKNEIEVKKYLGNTITLLVLSSIFLTVFLMIFSPKLLQLFGAKDTTYNYANEYLKYIVLGASFQILANGLTPIIRNYGKAILAMVSMILGFVTNILLDWLFISVLKYGMMGAAIATVIGQFVTVVPCFIFIIKKLKLLQLIDYKLSKFFSLNIIQTGLSPFGSAMAPYIVILIMNKSAENYGADVAVASYAIVSYVVSFVQLLLQGIGDGAQPLMSLYVGLKENENLLKTRKFAYQFAVFMSLLCTIVVIVLRNKIPLLFGASDKVMPITSYILPIFSISFIFLSFLRITTSYFYATKKNIYAYILIYGEPIVSFILLIFVLPQRLGLNGVWISIPTTHILLTVGAIYLIYKDKLIKNKNSL